MPSGEPWTKDQLAHITTMSATGYTHLEIAREVGGTRSGIKLTLRRLRRLKEQSE